MRDLIRRHGYFPLSEDPAPDPTVQFTRGEIEEWQAGFDTETCGVPDPFAATDLARYYSAGKPEDEPAGYLELYGVLGSTASVERYFRSPEYHRPFSRRTRSGQRSDLDCFGTSLLTLAYLRERVRCGIPMLGVPNVETIEGEQVATFLARQTGIEIFPMRTDSVWRSAWTRARGRRSLDRYLADARHILKTGSPPLSTLVPARSFVFILGVWPAEADIAHSDVIGIGHWYVVQARRDAQSGDLRYTVHANTDAGQGRWKIGWDEPSLFGLLTSFGVCKVAKPGSYPEGVLQEYRESRAAAIRSGYFDAQNYEQLYGDMDVRMQLPSHIAVLWWRPLARPPPGLRRSVTVGPRVPNVAYPGPARGQGQGKDEEEWDRRREEEEIWEEQQQWDREHEYY